MLRSKKKLPVLFTGVEDSSSSVRRDHELSENDGKGHVIRWERVRKIMSVLYARRSGNSQVTLSHVSACLHSSRVSS